MSSARQRVQDATLRRIKRGTRGCVGRSGDRATGVRTRSSLCGLRRQARSGRILPSRGASSRHLIGSLVFFSINQTKPRVTSPRRFTADMRGATFMYSHQVLYCVIIIPRLHRLGEGRKIQRQRVLSSCKDLHKVEQDDDVLRRVKVQSHRFYCWAVANRSSRFCRSLLLKLHNNIMLRQS